MAKPVTSMAKMTHKSTKKAVAVENYHTTNHKVLRLMLIANNHPICPKISSSFLLVTQLSGSA